MKWYEDLIYIKQCEKAEEIQKLWKDESGDFYVAKSDYYIKGVRHNIGVSTRPKEDCIWLPRQDQLQEMAVKDDVLPWTLIRRFFKWTLEIYTHDFGKTSMEQLWLAFVMKEKYNKTWNGENWICIKK